MTTHGKTTVSEFKATSSEVLSQIDVRGRFDFYTFSILLDDLEKNDISDAHSIIRSVTEQSRRFTQTEYSTLSRTFPLALHEYTHFIDSTATVWGANLLARTASAYTSSVPDETQFIRAKRHHDYLRGIRLPTYYTHMPATSGQLLPSKCECIPYIGKVFGLSGNVSERPVLFGRFYDSNGEMLVRSPISMVSLLEASAMAQELFCTFKFLSSSSQEFKAIEQELLTERMKRFLYDKRLTEYSVCVHLIANHLRCQDIGQAFMVCSIVVRAALNFPSALFDRVSVSSVSSVLGLDAENTFVQSAFRGVKEGDRGILFYLLCRGLPASSHENYKEARDGLSAAMRSLEIDEIEAVASAFEELWSLSAEKFEGEGDSMGAIRSTSLQNFTASTEGPPGYELPWTQFQLPRVLLGDGETALIAGRLDGAVAQEGFYHKCRTELGGGRDWIKRFSEACF